MSSRKAPFTEMRTAYDRYVTVVRFGLVTVAVSLTALLFFWPLLREGERSFVLNEERMQRAGKTVRIVSPAYEGTDSLNRLFTVSAARAEQSSPDDPTVDLEEIAARMDLGDGRVATARAADGVYDTDLEVLQMPGAMQFTTSDGYRLEAQGARVDLAEKMVTSDRPVRGEGPLGHIVAQRFTIDIDARKAVFEGNVRMRTVPAQTE